ncbi:tetratricopeptide repeat-containing sulfotransferase family protein [Lentisalinibacter orientalis]|uniref:tetratricopeptide repeat-containing sulfotransferase family protein n=1 Tax=Lentisalinibacter orientalis TaxID=2992241 RepID=UPI003866785A
MQNPNTNADAERALDAALARIDELLGSDPARADAEARALLEKIPGQPAALLFRAIARRLMNDPAAAVGILGPLCQAHPNAAVPRLQLGLALRETGDDEAALATLRRAVDAKPDFADAWLALADLLTALERTAEADRAFAGYIAHANQKPRIAEAGRALAENRPGDAEALLRAQLGPYPNDVVALCLLADAAERQERIGEAEELLARCIELAPGYRRARHNHAVVLMRQNRLQEGLAETGPLLDADPKNTDARKLKASILVRLLEYDESIRLCEELLAEDEAQPTVWTSLGHMLKSVGRREDCIRAYRKAIELAPGYGEAYWSLANLKTHSLTDEELDAIGRQLELAGLEERDRWHLHFAMGKGLEDRERYEESFRHYAEGNRLRRARSAYDIGEMESHVRRSKALLTGPFFADRAGFGAGAPDPVFIVGLPRSGSTLVEQILASHSRVEGTMELPNIAAIARTLDRGAAPAGAYPESLGQLTAEESRALGERYLEETRVQRKEGTPFFVDKMPNNFAHIGLIHLILPNARIIDVRRHPMACGLSLFKEHFARAQQFSYDLATIGRYYRLYADLMAHFDAVLPGRVHRVVYEHLVDDTESEVRRLLEYCGLPFEEGCLAFHENRRAVSTASSEQVRRPIFRSGLDYWRHYEPWLGPLEAELGDLVDDWATFAR